MQPLKKQLTQLEQRRDKLQAEKATLETSLADPGLYEDANKAYLTELLTRRGKLEPVSALNQKIRILISI